jgi:hypothetical protein
MEAMLHIAWPYGLRDPAPDSLKFPDSPKFPDGFKFYVRFTIPVHYDFELLT